MGERDGRSSFLGVDTESSDRHGRRPRVARELAMHGKELDQEPVEQPGLLDLACVARSVENFHLASGNARLQAERGLMGAVLAAAENDGRAFDASMVILGVE